MSRTILLADDSVTIRKIVEITFGDTDIRVATAASGREALERLEAIRPDVVIADVAMPGPSGYEICERIKRSSRPVPVLLLAGTFEPFDAERARACGADGHLVKPFESRALLSRVEQLLAAAATILAAPASPAPDAEIEAVLDEAAAAAGRPAEVQTVDAPAPDSSLPSAAPVEAVAEPEPVASLEAPTPPPAEESPALVALDVVPAEAPAVARETAPDEALVAAAPSPEFLDAVVREVVKRLSDETLREIAWEVVPDLAETIIKERLDEIERRERERR